MNKGIAAIAAAVLIAGVAGCSSGDSSAGPTGVTPELVAEMSAQQSVQCSSSDTPEECQNILLAKRTLAIDLQEAVGEESPRYDQAQTVISRVGEYMDSCSALVETDFDQVSECDRLAGAAFLRFSGLTTSVQSS